ncbi:MAG: AAA family ATPase [Candidatus Aenigmarchaeota archaeon]|nr:AAA family ATPase [Candidatus Aenigmarchaeota archaeon]
MSYYIIIRGPLGCGKSTVAERLTKILKAKCFAVDRTLDEHNLENEWEEGYISQKSFLRANEIVVPEAIKFLDKGTRVIFDGNFYWKSQIEDLIDKLDYPHYVFTLKAPLIVCVERDGKRDKTHGKDAVIAVYKKSTEFEYGTVIDVTKSLDKPIEEILSYLPEIN